MKRRFRPSEPGRSALERIDRRLDATDDGDNSEIIRLLRAAMFADVDELEASGTVKLPPLHPPVLPQP